MNASTPRSTIDEKTVHDFVRAWFEAINRPASPREILGFFVSDGLVLRLPTRVIRTPGEVRDWWATRLQWAYGSVDEPCRVQVRLTSPVHAEVSMTVSSEPADIGAERLRTHEHWSLVADDEHGLRIRTCTVTPASPRATENSMELT